MMERNQVRLHLWCFNYEYAADILSLVASGMFQLQNRMPYKTVMHYTSDISEYFNFHFNQWCYHWDKVEKEKKLGRWLGVAHQVGQSMCYWVLVKSGNYIAGSTFIPIPEEDQALTSLKERMERFTQSVHNVIGDHKKAIISGETLNDDGIYYNAFFETSEEIEGLTYPWDRNLGIPLEEQNDKTLTLDDYAGAQVVLLGKDIPFWTHVSSMLNIWMVKSRSTQQMPDQCQQ